MRQVLECRLKAAKHLHLADHMLTQTYPLLQDPKLLLTVLDNIFLALTNAMAALLQHERQEKRIPPFQDTFDSKFNMLKLKVAGPHHLSAETLQFILDVKSKVAAHRKSPVEFSREGKYVICSSGYQLETITIDVLKHYLQKAKGFLHAVEGITGRE